MGAGRCTFQSNPEPTLQICFCNILLGCPCSRCLKNFWDKVCFSKGEVHFLKEQWTGSERSLFRMQDAGQSLFIHILASFFWLLAQDSIGGQLRKERVCAYIWPVISYHQEGGKVEFSGFVSCVSLFVWALGCLPWFRALKVSANILNYSLYELLTNFVTDLKNGKIPTASLGSRHCCISPAEELSSCELSLILFWFLLKKMHQEAFPSFPVPNTSPLPTHLCQTSSPNPLLLLLRLKRLTETGKEKPH